MKIRTVALKVCKKPSLKPSTENSILLDFVNLSTMFGRFISSQQIVLNNIFKTKRTDEEDSGNGAISLYNDKVKLPDI